ncbi:hypothetical protein [Solicola gregarius]|uniref:Uncharacterized protein n=1 Tax=Solicola gregarius TaxID=2908642 RepID=A0AA46YLQ9_9ACTN|nr:hypothetical protein [Solicola gregarius]UYM06912.1 hypothetical protein L0C25_07505 [Solicola gregarius]
MRIWPGVLTVVLCGLLALTGYTSVYAVGAAVVLGQLLMSTLPAPTDRRGGVVAARPMVPVVAGSLVATGLMLRPETLVGADGTTAVEESTATAGFQLGLGPGVAVAVLLALFMQMTRRDGRELLVASVSYATASAVLAICMSMWVTIPELADGDAIVASGAAGAAAASVLWTVPGPRTLLGIVAVAIGGVAGGAFGYAVDDGVSTGFGAALGVTAALTVVVGRLAAAGWAPESARRLGFEGVLPLALAGPLVYLVGQFYVL